MKQVSARARTLIVRLMPAGLLALRARRYEDAARWAAAEKYYRLAATRRFRDPSYALRLATVLNRQGKNSDARNWAGVAVDSTLRAHYDARAALAVHGPYFAERHEMAEFIVRHRDAIQMRIRESLSTAQPVAGALKVFVYWNTPDTAPAIVKAARESLRVHVGEGLDLVELDDANLDEWVRVDPRMQKLLLGNPAQFSDYLRLLLLRAHGGFWLDATCLLTEDLYAATAQIRDEGAFLFRYAGSRVGSWFFWARPDSYILNAVLAVYELWWTTEGRLTNYFMWHDIVEMLYWTDDRYRAEWDAMAVRHPRAALELLSVLSDPFDESEFARIRARSFVHKLTHKLPAHAQEPGSYASRLSALASSAELMPARAPTPSPRPEQSRSAL